MTKQPLIILFGVLITSLILVGLVHAFAMGNVDGQWSHIEPENDGWGSATNDTWASGPSLDLTDFDHPEFIYTFYQLQSWYGVNIYDDWNQVRYGEPTGSESDFAGQSGFGFDGVNNVIDPLSPSLDSPFLLGKFCHFNNPIEADDEMEWVDLDFRVDNVLCEDGLLPTPDGVCNFSLRVTLDETDNNPEGANCTGGYAVCPYTIGTDSYCPCQNGVNSNGCADRVDIGALPLTDSFTCLSDGAPVEFKISILGLIPLTDSTETCSAEPNGNYSFTLISPEEADNCACLYGSITEVTGTAVRLNSFAGTTLEEGVILEWETASELDNLGFNLYRGESLEGERVKINAELIPSNTYPGSPFGARYEYIDTGADLRQGKLLPNRTYYYWLEDMDIFGGLELHGPVMGKTWAR